MASADQNGLALNYKRQRRSKTYRLKAVPDEIAQCRCWFLTAGATGRCLGALATYVAVTRLIRNIPLTEQPQELTLTAVLAKVSEWLSERPSETLSQTEAMQFLRFRIGIAEHAFNWGGYTKRNPIRNNETIKLRMADAVISMASAATTALETAISELRQRRSQEQNATPPAPPKSTLVQGTLF